LAGQSARTENFGHFISACRVFVGKFSEVVEAMRYMMDLSGGDPIDAGVGHAPHDSLCPEQICQPLFVAKTILERDYCSIVLQQRLNERLVKIIRSGLDRYEYEIDLRHLRCVGVKAKLVWR